MQSRLLRILTGLVVVLALAFPFLLALEKIHESDCFWHLKTGEWIFNNHAIPRADEFSSTVAGKLWLDWEWLFQTAVYFVYSVGGFKALVVVKAVAVGLTGFVIFDTSRRSGAGVMLASFVVLVTIVAAAERFELRPDVAMFLFAAADVAMLEAARRGQTKWLWGLPVVQVVWVNMHPSFPLGVCLVGAYVVSDFVGAVFNRDRSRLQIAPTVALLSTCIACVINPYGLELIKHAIAQTRGAGPVGVIGEWFPTRQLLLTEPHLALSMFWILFWVTPAALLARLVIERGKFPWAHALVAAGMSVLALRAHRFTALYAVVTAPMLAGGIAAIAGTMGRARGRALLQWIGTAAVGALALFLDWSVVTNRWAMFESRPARFGVGVDEQIVPIRALAVMEQLPVGLGLFNTFPSGGPLIWKLWPEWRVFTDGRANLYGREFVDRYRRALADPVEWESWAREKSVSVVFLQYGTGDDRGLLQYLASNPSWDLLYFDHAACIFVHQSMWAQLRANRRVLDLPHVRLTDPAAVLGYANSLADEVAPGDSYGRGRVIATVGNFVMAIGAIEPARTLFETALKENPRTSEAWMNLALIELDEGDAKRASELTEQLLARNPRYYPALLLQAQIAATEGDAAAGLALVERALKQQPHSAQAWLLLAQLAARQGDRATAIRGLQQTLAEKVEDVHLYLFLGQLLSADARTNEAIAAYEKCQAMGGLTVKEQKFVRTELERLRTPR